MSQPAPKNAAAPAPDEDIQAAWEMPLGEIGGGSLRRQKCGTKPHGSCGRARSQQGALVHRSPGDGAYSGGGIRTTPGATEAQLCRLRTHRYLRRTRGPAPVLSRLASNPVSINGGQHRGAYYEQRRGHRTPRQAPRCRQQLAAQGVRTFRL
ncbi:hypothetical protein MRX96_026231 [Rhipicephalus microplus]